MLWLYSKSNNVLTHIEGASITPVELYSHPNGYNNATDTPQGPSLPYGGAAIGGVSFKADGDVYVLTDTYTVQTGITYDYSGSGISALQQAPDYPSASASPGTPSTVKSILGTTLAVQGNTFQNIVFNKYKANGTDLTVVYQDLWNSPWPSMVAERFSGGFALGEYGGNIYFGSGECVIAGTRAYVGPAAISRTALVAGNTGKKFSRIAYADSPLTINSVDPNNGVYGTELGQYIAQQQLPFPRIVSPDEFSRLTGTNVSGNTDPFTPGGFSGGGVGGDGSFGRHSDTIGEPSLPTISAMDTGLVTLYVGGSGPMQQLASYLWSSAFDLDTFKKLFSDPMDVIIGCSIIPCTPAKQDNATIIFGSVDTQVNMPRATAQFVRVDCGTVSVPKYWGAYLDYSPYTKIHIFLPYIGFKELNTDEVMGKSVKVTYHVDCLSGALTAYIIINGTVYYQYSGSCATQVPLTANNWGQAIGSIIQVAGQAITGFATGGAGGALLSGGASLASNAITGGFKPEIQRNGSVTGAGGFLAVQIPYLIIESPKQSVPQSYNKFEGYPSNTTMFLYQCKGYTKVQSIRLDGFSCTGDEMNEIESILKNGVII